MPLWRLRFRRESVVRPHSIGKGLRDIQRSVSMVLGTRFHIVTETWVLIGSLVLTGLWLLIGL